MTQRLRNAWYHLPYLDAEQNPFYTIKLKYQKNKFKSHV